MLTWCFLCFLLTANKKDDIRKWTKKMMNPPPTVPHRLLTTCVTQWVEKTLMMLGCLCKLWANHGELSVAVRLCGLTTWQKAWCATTESNTNSHKANRETVSWRLLLCDLSLFRKDCVKPQFKVVLKCLLPLEDEEHLRWVMSDQPLILSETLSGQRKQTNIHKKNTAHASYETKVIS